MKKLLKTGLATILSCMMLGAAASAQVITNTGPGSNNQVITNNTSVRSCTNTNVVGVTNSSTQTSTSGAANTSGNTTGGNSTSGSASNSNNTSTSVAVANSCGATTANTPPNGGNGGGNGGGRGAGGSGAGADAELVASIGSLPETGTTSPAQYLAGSLAVISALTVAGYLVKQYATKAR